MLDLKKYRKFLTKNERNKVYLRKNSSKGKNLEYITKDVFLRPGEYRIKIAEGPYVWRKSISVGKEKVLKADKVILATGGKSYSATGSTGDGYETRR